MSSLPTDDPADLAWAVITEARIVWPGIARDTIAKLACLDGAEQMVRDYIESLTGRDTGNDEVTIKPEVGDGLDEAHRRPGML